ncbi:MAG: glycosyltransferase [Bacteroidia bacterium]|nr:glycosyltransferase [Bacteroidia bacterium]
MISIVIFLSIIAVYVLALGIIIQSSRKLNVYQPQSSEPKTGFTIIIPFRNEASNLGKLLASIKGLKYPVDHFEIILVNDNSDDDFLEIITNFQSKNENLNLLLIHAEKKPASPKKEAITKAIEQSRFEWIITTDADCIVPSGWLNAFSGFIENSSYKLIAGPVLFNHGNTLCSNFQYLDLLGLQTLTTGGFGWNRPFLCSGANLAYSKSFFEEVNGFEGNTDIASGDDLFLLNKAISTDHKAVGFMKSEDVLVHSKPAGSWTDLIHQRIRWATKTRRVGSKLGTFTTLIGLLTNLTLVAALILVFSGKLTWLYFIVGLLLKMGIDFLLIRESANLYNKRIPWFSYLLSSIIYPVFVLFIFVRSWSPSYHWKGRKFKV